MMKRALGLMTIGLAVPAPAHAAPGPFTYQCRAPYWDETGLWQLDGGPIRRVSGQIEVESLERIPAEWPPDRELRPVGPIPDVRGAEVSLSNSEDGNINVSMGIAPAERSEDLINILLSWQVGDQGGARQFVLPRRTGSLSRIPFAMLVDGQRVIVEAAGERLEAPVALGSEIEFRVSCQGGTFMFYGLDWDA